MRWRASKWPAAVLGANLDVCGWFFSCLSMMWLFWKFSQWYGCSRNSPEGEAASCTSRSCFSSRVWLHLCLLANGSPHIKNGAAALKEKLHGAAAFSCSEKIILSHPFLISFLWCSWCSSQWCASHLKTDAVVLLPMVRLSPPDSCGCSPQKNPPQVCVSHLQIHATVILKWCTSHQTYGGCSSQKILLKVASPTFRFMRLFSSSGAPPTSRFMRLFSSNGAPVTSVPSQSQGEWLVNQQIVAYVCFKTASSHRSDKNFSIARWMNRPLPSFIFLLSLSVFFLLCAESPCFSKKPSLLPHLIAIGSPPTWGVFLSQIFISCTGKTLF